MGKYSVPMRYRPARGLDKLTETPDYYIDVEYRTSGVRGLIITPDVSGGQPHADRWVLTHKHTGRTFPAAFPSVAAARRAAKAISDLADWDDPDLLFDMLKPSWRERLIEINVRILEEGVQP